MDPDKIILDPQHCFFRQVYLKICYQIRRAYPLSFLEIAN
jgi:hypothetical protein